MKIAIIGAGISGCNLYFNLKEKFNDITIFEKSRGTGGRVSTKYIDDKFIDHGTPFFIPQTDELKDFSLYLSSQNILKSRYDKFSPKNGINKICSFLVDKNDLKTQTKIKKADFHENKWILEDENQNKYEDFDMLFITIPAPQILEMQIDLQENIKSSLQKVKYDSRFSVILYSKDNKQLDENSFYENENIEDIINNSKKYLYKDFSSYVIHSTSNFANEHNNKTKEEIYEIFRTSLSSDLLEQLSNFEQIPHLWKFAFAKTSLDLPYYFDKTTKLGICGDYFHLNNLEGSYLSSSILSDRFI